jgi:hypothetical protein
MSVLEKTQVALDAAVAGEHAAYAAFEDAYKALVAHPYSRELARGYDEARKVWERAEKRHHSALAAYCRTEDLAVLHG